MVRGTTRAAGIAVDTGFTGVRGHVIHGCGFQPDDSFFEVVGPCF